MKLIFLFLCLIFSEFAWGRPDLPKPYVMAPVIIDGEARTQVWIFPRAERKQFFLEAAPLIQVLREFLRTDLEKKIEQRTTERGVVSLRDLDAIGLSADFSEETLEIRIAIPLKFRKNSDLNLNFNESGDQTYMRPTQQSGYLNLRTTQAYQYGDSTAPDTKQPLVGRADLVENINGFVFESGTEYNENAPYPWQRQDTHVIWDSEEQMLRFTAGDFNVNPKGFQASSSAAGLAVSREFSIQPYRTAKPLGNSELMIKRPSLVEIYINGVLYTQIRLNPGRFNIKDFPIVNGQNDVRVHIKDDLGQEESFNFSVLYENSILLKGLHEFGYFAGQPWTESGGDRAYNQNATLSSFYHRFGITDYITAGMNYQNFQSQSLLGAEISFISPLGFFSLDGGVSRSSPVQNGHAERLKFRSLDRILGYESKTILSLELERRELGFSPVSAVPQGLNPYESRIDAQLSRQFSDFFFAGIGGTYEKGAVLLADSRTYRANVVIPLNARFRVEGTYSETMDLVRSTNFFVSLFWIDTPGIHSVSSYYDSQNSTSNLNISRNNLKRYDDYRLNASVQNSSSGQSTDVNADYLSQPADFRLENYSSRSDLRNYNTASLGVNTALAWVGTDFAMTQPIQDSFALVAGENMPKKQVLLINSNGELPEAQLGPLDNAVLNQYTAYYKYTLNLDSTSLPMGYLLSKEFYYIQPTYKSGILIPVKLTSKVMVKGRLFSADKQVAALRVGDVYNDKNQLVDNNFFTNKEGVFVIEGLEPGRYYIRTDKSELGQIPLDVQATDSNLMTIDPLVAPSAKNEGGSL